MKQKLIYTSILIVLISLSITAFTINIKKSSGMKETTITYIADGVSYNGYVVYDEQIKGKRPAILVIHEWWGLNDYTKMRAKKLAALGYIAMAVDMYGNGKLATNPEEAKELASVFYKNPQLSKTILDAAINKIKEFEQTDTKNIAAIGYCFGGSVVLNAAKLGADLKAVVSFHGGLAGVPANREVLKANILVCHGGSDKFVTQQDIDEFKHQMDAIGAHYTFKVYANATHAFTNPESDNTAKKFNMPIAYNPKADKDSWNDMKVFLNTVFKK
jgi:dienelactone hydrolase